MQTMFRTLWVEDRDIAAEATIAQALKATGHDADTVLRESTAQVLDANAASAIELNLPGVPGYARGGEGF